MWLYLPESSNFFLLGKARAGRTGQGSTYLLFVCLKSWHLNTIINKDDWARQRKMAYVCFKHGLVEEM